MHNAINYNILQITERAKKRDEMKLLILLNNIYSTNPMISNNVQPTFSQYQHYTKE